MSFERFRRPASAARYYLWRYTKGVRIVGLGPLRGNDGLTPRQRKKDSDRYWKAMRQQ